MKLSNSAWSCVVVALLMGGIAVSAQAQSLVSSGLVSSEASSTTAPVALADGADLGARPHIKGTDLALARTLPDAPSYIPLSSGQKFHIFLSQAYSPYTFMTTAFDASLAQLSDDWPAYGQGLEGYGKRYGALLANHSAASFFGSFLLPTAFHQDPRYFRRGSEERFLPRLGYSASRVFITHTDDGHSTLNTSLLLSMLLVASLTNSYYPRPQRGFEETMSRFGGGLISTAQNNLLREFWPDLARLFHRHEPEELKQVERLAKKVPLVGTLASNDDDDIVQPASPAETFDPLHSDAPAPSDRKHLPD
jgi:hypothetical protein